MYKIQIFGGIDDGKTKGFFREDQLPDAIALMTQKYGKDWGFNIVRI